MRRAEECEEHLPRFLLAAAYSLRHHAENVGKARIAHECFHIHSPEFVRLKQESEEIPLLVSEPDIVHPKRKHRILIRILRHNEGGVISVGDPVGRFADLIHGFITVQHRLCRAAKMLRDRSGVQVFVPLCPDDLKGSLRDHFLRYFHFRRHSCSFI